MKEVSKDICTSVKWEELPLVSHGVVFKHKNFITVHCSTSFKTYKPTTNATQYAASLFTVVFKYCFLTLIWKEDEFQQKISI